MSAFDEWLNSIEFVDKEKEIISAELIKDISEDFDGDRTEE